MPNSKLFIATDNDFNKADLQQCRRDYARYLYNEITEDNTHEINYHCRGIHEGEGYNRSAFGELAKQLGHGRINIVIQSYFK